MFLVSVKMQTLADDTEAGAFGPKARNTKIKNLTAYLFSVNVCSIQDLIFCSSGSLLLLVLLV